MQLFGRRRKASRVLVLGLDCASPQLVFDEFKADLPVLSSLMRQGVWGELESCIPCITIPAWSSMLTSRDPGVLGCYGFRNRMDYSYDAMGIADSGTIRSKRVWDYLSEADRQSVVIGVPQTYPVRPINGHLISGLLTPGLESTFTFPAVFKQEVLKVAPHYAFDVKNFRSMDRAKLLQHIFDMNEVQFNVVEHTLKSKPWDFFMYVNIGVDRVHHGFWRYHDPQHRLHEANSVFAHAIRDYYKAVDERIGRLLAALDDDVVVLIVSDHGVKRMDGGICINEWLWHNGWLTLKTPPVPGKIFPFEKAEVDWTRTKAWASGGYYGRVFLNVAGREPLGIIQPSDYEQVRDELGALLAAIPGPEGQPLHTQLFKPQLIYDEIQNYPPDLMIYFGDLHWRAVGSLGYGQYHTLENDIGPDDANHDVNGLFILHDPKSSVHGPIERHQLMDIAPTVLEHLKVSVPTTLQGKHIEG